jgi:hypothetical protein
LSHAEIVRELTAMMEAHRKTIEPLENQIPLGRGRGMGAGRGGTMTPLLSRQLDIERRNAGVQRDEAAGETSKENVETN